LKRIWDDRIRRAEAHLKRKSGLKPRAIEENMG
jgi:hypothetical protein